MSTPETEGKSPLSLFTDPEFVALASARFVGGFTFATVILALALYVDMFSASGLVAGLFGSAYALFRLILVLPIGRYIDMGDAKRYLLAGLVINAATFVGFAFVSSAEHVIALRAFQGIGSTLLIIAAMTSVGEIAPPDERGRWIGTYNQTYALSSFAGDVAGGLLLTIAGFEPTYAVLVALNAVSFLLVVVFVRENPGGRADPGDNLGMTNFLALLRRNTVKALVAFRFSFSFGKTAVLLFLPIFARTEFGMEAILIGGIMAGGKLTKAAIQGYLGSLSDRLGRPEWFVMAGAGLYALGTALMPFATTVAGLPSVSVSLLGRQVTLIAPFFYLFGCYLLLGLSDSARIPTSMALFVTEGEQYDAVARSLSLRSVSWQIGSLVGPLMVGVILDLSSFLVAFWIAAGFVVLSSLAFLFLYDTAETIEPSVSPGD